VSASTAPSLSSEERRALEVWWRAAKGSDLPARQSAPSRAAPDIPTLKTLSAASILRQRVPDLKVRVGNAVDLTRLQPESEHPHRLSDAQFDALFTSARAVISRSGPPV
jgi:xylulose-5-phosphate/fructose-6-phosphate phosphoketolase